MTLEEIRLAIATRLATWEGAPMAWDGAATPPSVQAAMDATPKGSWVLASVQPGDGITRDVADQVTRTGLVSLSIFTAERQGAYPATQLADELIVLLEHYRAGDLKIRQANPSAVGPQDGWYRYNVNFPFVAY